MTKGTYDYNNLVSYCIDNEIILLKDYKDIKVTRDTIIQGKCINNCEQIFYKKFRNLKKTGAYCEFCTELNRKIKSKQKCLENYGVENPFLSEIIKEKIKNTNLERYGVEYQVQTDDFKNKSIQTCLKKYGVKYHIQSDKSKEKIKQTNLEKYNVENPFQSEEIKEKIKKTNLEKYGVENPTYSKEIKQQTMKNCLEKYGVEHTCQLDIVKQKLKESIMKKYDVEHPFQSEKYKQHFKNVCLEKYGFENPQQNPEIAEKTVKNSFRKKTYILPSGKELICQGYEPFALDKLIKEENICEDDIVTGCKNVPKIWYNDEQGKPHRHYVDIFIPNENRCIEVKSTWTAIKKKDNIYLKQKTAKELGYNYEIWIFDAKKQLVETKV